MHIIYYIYIRRRSFDQVEIRKRTLFSPFYILPCPFKKPHFVLYKGQPAGRPDCRCAQSKQTVSISTYRNWYLARQQIEPMESAM